MIRLLIASVSSVIACSALAAEVTGGSNDPPYTLYTLAVSAFPSEIPDLPESTRDTRTCDTTYVGPPGGVWQDRDNWTNGLPRPGNVACFPEDNRAKDALNALDSSGVITRVIGGSNDPPYRVWTYPNPPAPTAWGSCCLESTCMETDAFDCRELGGYFLEGVGPCNELVCATGACCIQDAECLDDYGDMDKSLCDIMNGDFLGGAVCENDPCQRFRIPEGFEIVELTPGWEARMRRRPRINNCGQIVVHIGTETSSWNAEIYLYDNGLLTQLTDNDLVDVFPVINDEGTIVWIRGYDGWGGGEVWILDDTSTWYISDGIDANINNLGHVSWKLHTPEPCDLSEYKCDIYWYDGNTIEEIADDGYSNQSPSINDGDQIAWTQYTFRNSSAVCNVGVG